ARAAPARPGAPGPGRRRHCPSRAGARGPNSGRAATALGLPWWQRPGLRRARPAGHPTAGTLPRGTLAGRGSASDRSCQMLPVTRRLRPSTGLTPSPRLNRKIRLYADAGPGWAGRAITGPRGPGEWYNSSPATAFPVSASLTAPQGGALRALEGLNPAQREAVQTTRGPLL